MVLDRPLLSLSLSLLVMVISAVREAFVIAKYQDHSFFKNEATHPASATAPPVPTERFSLGSSVVHEGDVIKVSGGKMFGGKKVSLTRKRMTEELLLLLLLLLIVLLFTLLPEVLLLLLFFSCTQCESVIGRGSSLICTISSH